MNEVQQVTEVARGITDFGMTVMTGAVYLILSALMMVAIFRWFKSIISQILEDNKQGMQDLLKETRQQNEMLCDLSDGLRTETQLRIRNLTGFAFDLAVEQVCRIIKKVRAENHIADREATARKIRTLLDNIYEDRKSRFDPFSYHGNSLSSYCNDEWIEKVAQVIEGEIYNGNGADNGRAYTNVKMIYDNIKIDFYHRLNNSGL